MQTIKSGEHVFEIVDRVPYGYTIWNIGKNMVDGYLPLCRLKAVQPFQGGRAGMGRTGENITCSEGVLEEMQILPDFRDFVTKSVMRYMVGDWGEVDPEDAEHNRKNPRAAIGAYTYNGEIRIYIKSEFLGTTVFFPDEY